MHQRMAAALKAAEESHLKWSAVVWRRPRHLFGAMCDEKYRAGCAQQILILLGHGQVLDEALKGCGTGDVEVGDMAGGSGSGSGGGSGDRTSGHRNRSRLAECVCEPCASRMRAHAKGCVGQCSQQLQLTRCRRICTSASDSGMLTAACKRSGSCGHSGL